MAKQILTNVGIFIDEFDLTADMNAIAIDRKAEAHDVTVFGNGVVGRRRLGGLIVLSGQLEGFWEGGTDAVDEVLWNRIGLGNTVASFAPAGFAAGDAVYVSQVMKGEYSPQGEVSGVFRFSTSFESNMEGGLAQGNILHNATRTTSGNGTAYQVGSVATGGSAWAALHVLAASGTSPTLAVTVSSDDAVGFPSGTLRHTFLTATDVSNRAQIVQATGPITDDYWRISYTIGGGSPSFTFVVSLGIV